MLYSAVKLHARAIWLGLVEFKKSAIFTINKGRIGFMLGLVEFKKSAILNTAALVSPLSWGL